MITVTTKENEFTIEGHANFDVLGKDIVCSALSFLAQSVVDQLANYVEVNKIVKSGYMNVRLLTKSNESSVIMKLFRESTLTLSQEYPENVTLLEKTFASNENNA